MKNRWLAVPFGLAIAASSLLVPGTAQAVDAGCPPGSGGKGPGGPYNRSDVAFGPASVKYCQYGTHDTGQAYNDNGGAWETLDGTPIDVSKNARARKNNEMFIHMDYRGNAANGVTRPVRFQKAFPNGTVDVSVTVGDSEYTDSKHVVRVEGQVIGTFIPTAKQKTATFNGTVKLADNRVTIDSIGGTNTKIQSISLNEGREAKPQPSQYATYVFGPSSFKAGGTTDFGQPFTAAKGYGWLKESDSTPFDITKNTRERPSGDVPRSLIHMDYRGAASSGTSGKAKWEKVLPNGKYRVTTGLGDTAYFDSMHQVQIEGGWNSLGGAECVVNAKPEVGQRFCTNDIEVKDGKLTISTPKGTNTKLFQVNIEKF